MKLIAKVGRKFVYDYDGRWYVVASRELPEKFDPFTDPHKTGIDVVLYGKGFSLQDIRKYELKKF